MMPGLLEHLNQQELNTLRELLRIPDLPVDNFYLEKVHGFITAIAASPSTIFPSKWQPYVMNGIEFESQEQAETYFGLSLLLYNQINSELQSDNQPPFLPLGYPDLKVMERWCSGFLLGTDLDTAWKSNDYVVTFLLPLAVLAGEFSLIGDKDDEGNIIHYQSKHIKKFVQDLPDIIQGFHDHFREQRQHTISHDIFPVG